MLCTGCDQSQPQTAQADSAPSQKPEVVAAPKLNNDATVYANQAYVLMNQLDVLVRPENAAQLDQRVREPVRALATEWRINVKMTDSVTEGRYALCRKALTSLDIWARETAERGKTLAEKQANYLRDKKLCKGALSTPELGNTDPKENRFAQ